MERRIMNGNQAAALAVKLSRAQVVCAYPITPQTSLVENIANMWAQGNFPGEYVSVESEYSALSYLIGAAYAGARTFTATSCQGLAYMHELLHWSSGARLPIVMVNVNRTLGAPWSLEQDQLDSLSQRDTGWLQFFCSDVQEILETVIYAFRIAEETLLPCMVSYDGFSLSHTYEAVKIPSQEQVDSFLLSPPSQPLISPSQPETIQAVRDSRYMAPGAKIRHQAMMKVLEVVEAVEQEYADIFGYSYPPVENLYVENSDTVIVAAGAVAQTVKSVLYQLEDYEEKKGLLRLRLFRPLPREQIISLLDSTEAKNIVVIDRDISAGTGGIFAQELRALLQRSSFRGKIFELNLAGGVDLTREMLCKALDIVESGLEEEEIIWGVDL